jgi:hypothetical protein
VTAPVLLRGKALKRLAQDLEELRKVGAACWRCPRLLAAGARCPDHGAPPASKRPPAPSPYPWARRDP